MTDVTQMSDADLMSLVNQTPDVSHLSDEDLLQLAGVPPKASAPKATAADRLDAAESGILSGAAYLASAIPDAAANAYNLGKAGLGYGYSKVTGNAPPTWLEASDPNPVGNWLTSQMNKTDLLHTDVRHPEDPASRWLHTAGSVIPGALTGGGGTVGGTTRALIGGEAGAGAAQGVHEWHPFTRQAGETAAETGAGLLGALGGSRLVPGAPVRTPQNDAVIEGQGHGYKFPAAVTNPTVGTKLTTRIAGGPTVQDAAQSANQPITNAGAREDLQLGGEGPITPVEREQIRTQTNAAYNAVTNSGATFRRDLPLIQALQAARARFTNTSSLAPSLASSPAAKQIDELMGITRPGGKPRVGSTFSARDGVATVESLRDASRTAARNGQMGDATAYRNAAKAVEDSMDRALPPDLVSAWRAARVRRAQLHSAEDAMDPNGNVDATELGKAYEKGAPLSGNMAVAARSANAAPKAFRVPESGPTGGHGGFWGPFIGASVGSEALAHLGGVFGHPEVGIGPLATWAGYTGSRAVARRLALANALARQREPTSPAAATAAAYFGTRGPPAESP